MNVTKVRFAKGRRRKAGGKSGGKKAATEATTQQ
jgi:hypothetical protein